MEGVRTGTTRGVLFAVLKGARVWILGLQVSQPLTFRQSATRHTGGSVL